MQFTSIIIPTVLLFAANCNAWSQAGNGVWVANNIYYNIRGTTVHEACTTMNTQDIHANGVGCAFWLDGAGDVFNGKCSHQGGSVLCIGK
ncbi:hypothetical protein ACMFMF_003647 [Clarireedia jacksonii]